MTHLLAWALATLTGLTGVGQHELFVHLFTRISVEDAQVLQRALHKDKIPSRLAENGSAIHVPFLLEEEARLKLAFQGLPREGVLSPGAIVNSWGDTSYGGLSTDFERMIFNRRQRLKKTTRIINRLIGNESATIDYSLYSRNALFEDEPAPPKATIEANINSNLRHMRSTYIKAIQVLTATFVKDLSRSRVTVYLRS